MKNTNRWIAVVCIAFLSTTCLAQDDEGPLGFSYVTYYGCDQATQGQMDNVVEANEKAVFDKWVEDGKIMAWGYLSHFTGGRWRRAQYHVSPTMADALDNQVAIFQEIYADNPDGGQARAEACGTHDDYVWALEQGSGPGTDRGNVSLSTYFVCDVTRQLRADDIVEQIQAPKLEEMKENKKIASWGWQSHRIGGDYRRLLTITGEDYASVVAANAEMLENANENHADLSREFGEICGSHSDYLWDIVHESP